MRRIALLLAFLTLVPLAACGSGGPSAFQVVSKAAADTTGAGPARLAMHAQAGGVSLTASGVADLDRHLVSLKVDLPGTGGVAMVQTSKLLYLQVPKGSMPGVTTPWVSIDPSQASEAATGVTQGVGDQDPAALLATLQGASANGVKTVGHDTLRGVKTTQYHADVDLQKAVKQKGTVIDPAKFQRFVARLGTKTLPVDVWIDDAGIVHQVQTEMKLGGTTTTIRVELYDFGKVQPPTPPPSDQVTDVTDKVIAAQRQQPTTSAS